MPLILRSYSADAENFSVFKRVRRGDLVLAAAGVVGVLAGLVVAVAARLGVTSVALVVAGVVAAVAGAVSLIRAQVAGLMVRERRQRDRLAAILAVPVQPLGSADPFSIGVFASELAEAARGDVRRPEAGDARVPPYVPRMVDAALCRALEEPALGRSGRMVVVRGDPKSGKSRALWEAVRVLPGRLLVAVAQPDPGAGPQDAASAPLEALAWLDRPVVARGGRGLLIWVDDAHAHLRHGLTRDVLRRIGAVYPQAIVAMTIRNADLDALRSVDRPLHALLRRPFDQLILSQILNEEELVAARDAYPALADDPDLARLPELFAAVNLLTDLYCHHGSDQPAGVAVARAVINWQRAGMPAWSMDEPALRSLARLAYADIAPNRPLDDQAFLAGMEWATAEVAAFAALVLRRPSRESGALRFGALESIVSWAEIHDPPLAPRVWEYVIGRASSIDRLSVGIAAFRAGQPRMAIGALHHAAAAGRSPTAAQAFFYRGVILGELGSPEAAVTAYDQVLVWYGGGHDLAMAEPALAELVARSLVGRNAELGKLGVPAGKAAFDQVIGVAGHLAASGHPEAALEIIDSIPYDRSGYRQRHEIRILRGNALACIPGKASDALGEFGRALADADQLDAPDRLRLIAEACREQGRYFRVIGRWKDAARWYGDAHQAMTEFLAGYPDEDRRGAAEIYTEWGYLCGLNGNYTDGLTLAQNAITILHRMGLPFDEGMSQAVCGVIYRYARRYEAAWQSYLVAGRLFRECRNRGRVGFVQQQQAICLLQAAEDGVALTSEPLADARRLIGGALELCKNYAIRDYPSALNRAGRIYSRTDPGAALSYLRQGITEARLLSDGWFWFANVVGYAELLYRRWVITADKEHYREIIAWTNEARMLAENYQFPDLAGRWQILQAHLSVDDYTETANDVLLDGALENYKAGFGLLSERLVGSSGIVKLDSEFQTFTNQMAALPAHVRQEWYQVLRSAWSDSGPAHLLARLEESRTPAG